MSSYLSTSDLSTLREAFDNIMDTFEKDCTVVYPPIIEDCDNCSPPPIGGRRGHILQHGVWVPCNYCNATGTKEVTSSETISVIVEFNPKDIRLPVDALNVPFGFIRVKSLIVDVPKILNAQYLVVAIPSQPYIEARYTRFREPIDEQAIIQARYSVSYWKRTG